MTRSLSRVLLCMGLLTSGLVAEAGLERFNRCERPELLGKLAEIPMTLGHWIGREESVDPRIIEEAQTDDWLSRTYTDPTHPGRSLSLWINYSRQGLNMRHSPEVCLPSGGWTKVEASTKVFEIDRPGGQQVRVTRLGYEQGELVQEIGFWYYIFGEGPVERWVRRLPVTSRSSHGRTTRGSGLTVEVFCPGQLDPDGEAIKDFTSALLASLEPLLPSDRAEYHVP
jgi:EpsI family protein